MKKLSLSRCACAAAAVATFLLVPVHAGPSIVRTQYTELCQLLAAWDPTRTETSVVPEPPPQVPGRWNGLVAGANSVAVSVNYSANFDPLARAAFQSAVDIWASQITSSVPITVNANWVALGSGVLGTAGGQLVQVGGVGVADTWYPKALLNKLAGSEQFPGTVDITANFNSAFNTQGGWYFGVDGKAPANMWDFKSVVLHELGHGLGFSGSAQSDGATGSYGFSGGTGSFPVIYDRFVESAARQAILNTTLFPNPSAALHNVYTSELTTDLSSGLFWNGAAGVSAAGGAPNRPRLDARTPFSAGSNYSHLSESTYPLGSANSLMTRSLFNGEVVHNPGSITLGLFHDMGWAIPSVPPFGSFDTPAEASTVTGSIAVTGWALDNAAVTKVSIFRDANAGDPPAAVVNGRVYVGDAAFVAGARSDIAAAYAAYPNASRAGWGYMLLTRGVIWDGKGPFKLHAVAFDVEGNQTQLGSKTITINNAAATKPFGSIDAPGPGATMSGNYPNTGWVLVPGTGVTIPASGVQVFVDSTPIPGPPSMSARADISAGFPGFDTSQAGRGLFIDTTKFTNGIHTIVWNVTASNGQADGIGSRYIQIQNGAQTAATAALINRPASALPGIDNGAPVRVATTLGANAPQTMVRPDVRGRRRVQIDELGRIAVRSVKGQTAYHIANGQLRALPLGATYDATSGTFFWQTSAGFVGDYEFVVVDENRRDAKRLTHLVVSVGDTRLLSTVPSARATN